MKIIQSNPYGSLSEAGLLEFESRLGFDLPEEYRHFLLKHNGPLMATREFAIPEREYTSSLENGFYGLHDEEGINFEMCYFADSSYFPQGCLPIAGDECGNYVCLGLKEEFRGLILFFEYGQHLYEPSLDDLFVIANSFSEFLEGLREAEPVEKDDSPTFFDRLLEACLGGRAKTRILFADYVELVYLSKGTNKDLTRLPDDFALDLLDELLESATSSGKVTRDFAYGSSKASLEYMLKGNQRISIHFADTGYVLSDGKYLKIPEPVWTRVSGSLGI